MFYTPSLEHDVSSGSEARSMTKRLVLSAFVLALVSATPAAAGPLQTGIAAYNAHNYPVAAKLLLPLAEQGYARAQTYVGFMYATGRGVPQDYIAAARWYRHAGEQGVGVAQFMLGLMYDKGQGVPQDFVQAYMWLNLATAQATPHERDYWRRIRDAVASKLSLVERTAGQRLAAEWYMARDRRPHGPVE
jgi:TPR repeat protein